MKSVGGPHAAHGLDSTGLELYWAQQLVFKNGYQVIIFIIIISHFSSTAYKLTSGISCLILKQK